MPFYHLARGFVPIAQKSLFCAVRESDRHCRFKEKKGKRAGKKYLPKKCEADKYRLPEQFLQV